MLNTLLPFLDSFFFIFHTLILFFNLFGWIWRSTRKANLALLSLTAFSWFGLGIWYSWGYCPCTDWHWQVKRSLGQQELPYSYIKYLLDTLLGTDLDAGLVDATTVALFLLALFISAYLNYKEWKQGRL
ncbi:MAG: DUF2784 domain-containing protein [Nitrospinota bacterium]|nr:DUF2784 domain-containing protein [Nitrospinota bacterium]